MKKWWDIHKAALANLSAEFLMGATNIGGVVGNGRLTAGISRWGEITALRWPTPSHFDQVDYVTRWFLSCPHGRVRMGGPSPSPDFSRWGRPFVQREGMGSFGGVIPGSGRTIWLHDPEWEFAQRYLDDDSPVLCTSMRSSELNLLVTVTDLVPPDIDALVRNFKIKFLDQERGGDVRFVYYENFSPSSRRTPIYPINRFLGAKKDDFAAIYSPGEGCFIHFNPKTMACRFKRYTGGHPGPDRFMNGSGTYIAWGSESEPSGYNVGPSGPPGISGTLHGLAGCSDWESVYESACRGEFPKADQHLGRCSISAGWDALISPGKIADLTVYITFGLGASAAIEALNSLRSRGYSEVRDDTSSHWKSWLLSADLPGGTGPETGRVLKRALVTIPVCRDRESGAIVASIAGQPLYCLDWTGDGAFLDLTLDLAGYADLVTSHLYFYDSIQFRGRKLGPLQIYLPGRPPGHFPSNCYTDGRSGNISYTEIDQTALVIWDIWRHSTFLEGGKRERFLEDLFNTVTESANALLKLLDPRTGIRRRYHEGDNPFRTRTLHGIVACYLGLVSASLVGLGLDHDPAEVGRWREGAIHLGQSALDLYDESRGRFRRPGWHGPTWSIWPAGILPWKDERAAALASNLLADFEEVIYARRGALTYQLEYLLVSALVFRDDRATIERIREMLEFVSSKATTPGTNHFGEVSLIGDFDSDGRPEFQNRTSIPHVWKGALVYMVAEALQKPEELDRLVPTLGT